MKNKPNLATVSQHQKLLWSQRDYSGIRKGSWLKKQVIELRFSPHLPQGDNWKEPVCSFSLIWRHQPFKKGIIAVSSHQEINPLFTQHIHFTHPSHYLHFPRREQNWEDKSNLCTPTFSSLQLSPCREAIFLFQLLPALYTLTEGWHTVHEHFHLRDLWKPSFKCILQGGKQIMLMYVWNSLLGQEMPPRVRKAPASADGPSH